MRDASVAPADRVVYILIEDRFMYREEDHQALSEFSLRTRARNLAEMQRNVFDLTVIGGGITGAGIAFDAASRGLTVALIEKRDFASGTSSRSSKLIHGGLRYLEQFEFSLVRESLHERATLTKIAPHLARPLQFLVPVYSRNHPSPLGSNKLKLRAGLWLYDLLAGRRNIESHRWIDKKEALQICPHLDAEDLRGAFLYSDCLTDDARLVIEVIKSAAAYGARMANYTAVLSLEKTKDRISGVHIQDLINGEQFSIRSQFVVNATGVWGGEISRMDQAASEIRLRPSKGIHIILPAERLPIKTAALIPSLGEQRFLFVIPWLDRIVIGTTDTDYKGDRENPVAEEAEIARIVESAAQAFPRANLSISDVISSYAGLRPLVGGNSNNTKDLSRKDQIIESQSGLISIMGGKLTTYRHMAERVVDKVVTKIEDRPISPCSTEKILLAGGAPPVDSQRQIGQLTEEYRVSAETVQHLMGSYGGNYRKVLDITLESEESKSRLVEDLPHIEAEVIYSARAEMIATVEDFLSRRTRIRLLAVDQGKSCEERVARLMGRELGWSVQEIEDAINGEQTRERLAR